MQLGPGRMEVSSGYPGNQRPRQQQAQILHIYAAKGMRAYTLAAAERMKFLRRLDVKEHRGKTPLLVAVTARQPAIVYDLIQAGADVNAVDNKGQSALHLAATYVSLGLFLSPILDFSGHTPLHCAVLAHNALLREQGCQMLTEEQQKKLQHQSEELESCIHLLVQTGASIYSRDVKSNKTVLHYTVQDGNLSLLRYFLELNAFKSKDFVNNKAHGNTALHMAAALPHDKNQKEIVQLLLDHGADPSIRNLDNDQPIHMAPSGKAGDQVHNPHCCCFFQTRLCTPQLFVLTRGTVRTSHGMGLVLRGVGLGVPHSSNSVIEEHKAGISWQSKCI
uniref:NF-kappa-B inhibitor delta n=1 Tax=Amazona collaria TaxID=241587 RepID=A0A8B9GAG2_9PSIT